MSDRLPEYARRLEALHHALADDFDAIVGQAPLTGGEVALDAGCGDGFFTELLARRLTSGEVIALDTSAAYLEAARARLGDQIRAGRVRLVEGDVNGLPFETGSVDVVWSAHSMQSYDDLPAVLAEFRRVLRPGGLLAVLESDAMHSIMLPWPPRLELALRQAERRSLGDPDERMGAYFPRYAAALLREAGFGEVAARPTFIFHAGPLAEPLRKYVGLHIEDSLKKARGRLDEALVLMAERLAAAYAAADERADGGLYFGSLQVLFTAAAGRGGGE